MRNVRNITQPGWNVLNIYFGSIGLRTELLVMLLDDKPALHYVVLLSAPVVTIQVEPEVFLAWPYELVFVYQLSRPCVL